MPRKYHHITLEERALIQTQFQLRFKPTAIAAGLNRPRFCATREFARKGWRQPSHPASRAATEAGGYSSPVPTCAHVPHVKRTTLYVALVNFGSGTTQATADGFGTILQRFDLDIRLSLKYSL